MKGFTKAYTFARASKFFNKPPSAKIPVKSYSKKNPHCVISKKVPEASLFYL
jgi:hypothetical protein